MSSQSSCSEIPAGSTTSSPDEVETKMSCLKPCAAERQHGNPYIFRRRGMESHDEEILRKDEELYNAVIDGNYRYHPCKAHKNDDIEERTEDDFVYILEREYTLQSTIEHIEQYSQMSKRFEDGNGFREIPNILACLGVKEPSIMTPLLVRCFGEFLSVELTNHACQECKYQFLMHPENFKYFAQLVQIHTLDVKVDDDSMDTFRETFKKMPSQWMENVQCLNIIFDGEIQYNVLRKFKNLRTLRVQHNSRKACVVSRIVENLKHLESIDLHSNESSGGYYIGEQMIDYITQRGKYHRHRLPRHILIHQCICKENTRTPRLFLYNQSGEYHPSSVGFNYFFFHYEKETSHRHVVPPTNSKATRLKPQPKRDPDEARNAMLETRIPDFLSL